MGRSRQLGSARQRTKGSGSANASHVSPSNQPAVSQAANMQVVSLLPGQLQTSKSEQADPKKEEPLFPGLTGGRSENYADSLKEILNILTRMGITCSIPQAHPLYRLVTATRILALSGAKAIRIVNPVAFQALTEEIKYLNTYMQESKQFKHQAISILIAAIRDAAERMALCSVIESKQYDKYMPIFKILLKLSFNIQKNIVLMDKEKSYERTVKILQADLSVYVVSIIVEYLIPSRNINLMKKYMVTYLSLVQENELYLSARLKNITKRKAELFSAYFRFDFCPNIFDLKSICKQFDEYAQRLQSGSKSTAMSYALLELGYVICDKLHVDEYEQWFLIFAKSMIAALDAYVTNIDPELSASRSREECERLWKYKGWVEEIKEKRRKRLAENIRELPKKMVKKFEPGVKSGKNEIILELSSREKRDELIHMIRENKTSWTYQEFGCRIMITADYNNSLIILETARELFNKSASHANVGPSSQPKPKVHHSNNQTQQAEYLLPLPSSTKRVPVRSKRVAQKQTKIHTARTSRGPEKEPLVIDWGKGLCYEKRQQEPEMPRIYPLEHPALPPYTLFGYIPQAAASRIRGTDGVDESSLLKFQQVLERGQCVGKYRQGVKSVTDEEAKKLGLESKSGFGYFKVKPLGEKGDERLFGTVEQTKKTDDGRNHLLICFDRYAKKGHKSRAVRSC